MFKTIRRYYWLSQVFIKKHFRVIAQTTLTIASILTIFIVFSRYLPAPKDTIKIARVGKYTLSTLPNDIERQLSQGLVNIDASGNITPGLATSWTIENDGKNYRFNLDKNITWHDGTTLTSADITYNFQDVDVARNDNEITFFLKESFSPFMQAMTKPILKNATLGTSTTRIVKYKAVSGILQSLVLETPTTRLIYKFYPTENSAVTAYKLGEVTKLEKISLVPQELHNSSASVINDTLDNKITALFFNNHDTLLASKTTRQGLAYAIIDKTFNNPRALSPIAADSWAHNDLVKDYQYDIERAKTLFTQDVKNSSEVRLELKTMLPYLSEAEAIAQNWRDNLGISVDVKVVSSVTSDYQIILADFAPPKDPDQYTLWHSTQPTNFTHYSSLKVDKLLEDGRRTLDFKLRKEIYQDFQRFLLEDCPAVFLFETASFDISRRPLL